MLKFKETCAKLLNLDLITMNTPSKVGTAETLKWSAKVQSSSMHGRFWEA